MLTLPFIIVAITALVESFPRDNRNVSRFVVNGRDADIADFPHQLALINRGSFICGAAVIHPLFAVTAAHCLDLGTPPEYLNLWGGSTSRVSGGHLFFIREYHLHPQFRTIQLTTGQVIWDYDVGVIRVDDGFRLEGFPNVLPTVLPEPCLSECCGVCEGTEIRVAGWVSESISSLRSW